MTPITVAMMATTATAVAMTMRLGPPRERVAAAAIVALRSVVMTYAVGYLVVALVIASTSLAGS